MWVMGLDLVKASPLESWLATALDWQRLSATHPDKVSRHRRGESAYW